MISTKITGFFSSVCFIPHCVASLCECQCQRGQVGAADCWVWRGLLSDWSLTPDKQTFKATRRTDFFVTFEGARWALRAPHSMFYLPCFTPFARAFANPAALIRTTLDVRGTEWKRRGKESSTACWRGLVTRWLWLGLTVVGPHAASTEKSVANNCGFPLRLRLKGGGA